MKRIDILGLLMGAGYTALMRNRFFHFGRKSIISWPSWINKPENVWIGDYTIIGPYSHLDTILGHDKKCVLKIGNNVSIGPFLTISAINCVEIGNDVLISHRCMMGDTGHEYEDVTKPIIEQNYIKGGYCKINDGAWIGVNVYIGRNVTIEENSVIGANSVVVNDIPSYSVAAGVPAQIIKKYDFDNFMWKRVTKNNL